MVFQSFNPFKEKGMPIEKQLRSWSELNVKPVDKNTVHPYTRTRIITANGAEMEGVTFSHQFARHTDDMDLKRSVAMSRRIEQQQQKMINWLLPGNASPLETTIGYEQVAVDLTAWFARHEKDMNFKAGLDFALLEDFDHLYRYANLLEMTQNIKAETICGEYTEIMPGRPTISEHRHPFDEVRNPVDFKQADPLTQLQVMIIIAAEQQTMNYYMNVGPQFTDMTARGLYQEIAMIEEQHVTHYESFLDPHQSWFMGDVMHQLAEIYLYWSFTQHETDNRIKQIWEQALEMEIGHLQLARETMKKYEKQDPADRFPEGLPGTMITFESNIDYVREVIESQVDLSCNLTEHVLMNQLPKDHRYFKYQERVNQGGAPSQNVIDAHIKRAGRDYRFETKPHPVERFRERELAVK